MPIEKLIHRKASDYVAALQNPDAPELESQKNHVPLETGKPGPVALKPQTVGRGAGRPPTDATTVADNTLHWRKIASVTPGGKHHFWFAYSYGGMSVAWDRLKRQWGASYGSQLTCQYFATARAGKEYLQSRVNTAAKGVAL